jgi:alpha-glucuronidase
MPREPFSPLFGAMPKTALSLELQITQEYLGQGTQLAYLGTMWKEVFDADTHVDGPGSTIARIIEGKQTPQTLTVIAGVANTGTDRNWTGHPLSQSNWYAFGRLAWDPGLSAGAIAEEWTRMSFGNDPKVVTTLTKILLGSHEAVVNYSMPLGLHHLMASDHHYGPGPWVDNLGRPDWNPVYYHRADAEGLGFERTSKGSGALAQYAPEVVKNWGDLATCPDELLLWFHHVPWDYRMRSGTTLWDELCLHYQRGVDEVRVMQAEWDSLAGLIDAERYSHAKALFKRQEKDARDWRDGSLLYFQEFSKRPLPAGVEPPAHSLDYYKAIDVRPAPGQN